MSAETLQLCLLLAGVDHEAWSAGCWRTDLQTKTPTSLQTIAPVELIYLHGPHFQDRYGIAEAALSPLQKADIPILAAGCSGTSVYIVVPENRRRWPQPVLPRHLSSDRVLCGGRWQSLPTTLPYKIGCMSTAYRNHYGVVRVDIISYRERKMEIVDKEIDWRLRVFDSMSFPTVILLPDKTIVAANNRYLEKIGRR